MQKRNFACQNFLYFLKNKTFPKTICYEYHQSVKQFGPKLLRLHILSRSNLLAKIISRRQKLTSGEFNIFIIHIPEERKVEYITNANNLFLGFVLCNKELILSYFHKQSRP